MIIREAHTFDIPEIQVVRHSVKENILSDPSLVTNQLCAEYLTVRGKGWVCEVEGIIAGFAIVDLKENNVWALFLRPTYEGFGIGKKLHDTMLNWYFSQKQETIWLSTGFNTRAEKFYRRQGWQQTGLHGSDEIRFEMTYETWLSKRAHKV